MNMKIAVLILTVLILNVHMASAKENEYGIVKAWFNGQNATVEGITLKVGEPAEIKVVVTSKVDGHVYLKLNRIGKTEAYEVISGPSKYNQWKDYENITKGWSNNITWIVAPTENWTGGNSAINILVQFYSKDEKNSKKIEFSVANPYILNERYEGSTPKLTPAPTETASDAVATPSKSTPFPSAVLTLGMLLLVWRWGRG